MGDWTCFGTKCTQPTARTHEDFLQQPCYALTDPNVLESDCDYTNEDDPGSDCKKPCVLGVC